MIRYRLDDLGWHQFEWLCQSLLKHTLGGGVEAWGGRGDWGRDAFCGNAIELVRGTKSAGPVVFQAKFVEQANAAGADSAPALREAVAAECRRIRCRGWGTAEVKSYVLLTNAPLSADLRREIPAKLRAALPSVGDVMLWGGGDLCAMLDGAPHIRVAFPQLLGLRDLTELIADALDKPLRERDNWTVERAVELAATFVPTSSYSDALRLLDQHHFVVLTGPPEMGKTTIARIIGLAKMAEGWECHECRLPSEFFALRSATHRQVFIADDTFGSTEYRPELAHEWAAVLDSILRALGPTHWLIWTSRPAPLKIGLSRAHLQGRAEHFPSPSEMVVDASQLETHERALILYRHAKAAGLESLARDFVRRHAKAMVDNPHFTPERVRRFVADRLPKLLEEARMADAAVIAKMLAEELSMPTAGMRKSFDALPASHQLALISMLDAPEGWVSLSTLQNIYERHVTTRAHGEPERVVTELSGHFLRVVDYPSGFNSQQPGTVRIDWIHPSLRDVVVDYLAHDMVVRHTFLGRCGAYGCALALSSGGGADGTRRLPLFRTARDLRPLSDAITRTMNSGSHRDIALVFSALVVAWGGGPVPGGHGDLEALTAAALEQCLQRWNTEPTQLRAQTVRQFYQLRERISRRIPSPDLLAGWRIAWAGAVETFDQARASGFEEHFDMFTAWAELAILVRDNEPQVLRSVGFPVAQLPAMSALVEAIDDQCFDDVEPRPSDHECEQSMKRLDSYKTLLAMVSDLIPELASAAKSSAARVEGTRGVLEEYVDERRRDWAELHGEDPYEGMDDEGDLEVESIFSDL